MPFCCCSYPQRHAEGGGGGTVMQQLSVVWLQSEWPTSKGGEDIYRGIGNSAMTGCPFRRASNGTIARTFRMIEWLRGMEDKLHLAFSMLLCAVAALLVCFGHSVCAIVFVTLACGDATPLLLSPCNTWPSP